MKFWQRLSAWLSPDSSEHAIVDHVIDGDSVRLLDGREVRYLGIDAPELHDGRNGSASWAEKAKATNARLVQGHRVRLEREVEDRDFYGRLLRHVYIGRTWVNGKLVEMGLARVRRQAPNDRRGRELDELQAKARRRGRGIWQRRSWWQFWR